MFNLRISVILVKIKKKSKLSVYQVATIALVVVVVVVVVAVGFVLLTAPGCTTILWWLFGAPSLVQTSEDAVRRQPRYVGEAIVFLILAVRLVCIVGSRMRRGFRLVRCVFLRWPVVFVFVLAWWWGRCKVAGLQLL